MRYGLLLTAAIALLLVLGRSESARAAFPGTNGRIAYSENDDVIKLVNPTGSGRTTLSNALTNAASPDWSADGTEIVYTHFSSGVSRLRHADVGGASDDGIPNTEGASQPSWSPDSQQIAFRFEATPQALGDIAVINRNGSGFTNLTNTPNEDEYSAAWSPNGQQIAFVRDTAGVEDLWVMDADGNNARNVSNDPDRGETAPDWSPAGGSVALDYSEGSEQKIGIMDIDTGALTPLTDGPSDFDPSFSPNGQQIVFQRYIQTGNGSNSNIFVMDADGGNQTNISMPGDGVRDYYPNWGVDIPGPLPLTWGDNNCSGSPNPADALYKLVYEAQLGTTPGGCPTPGETVPAAGYGDLTWGDLNCSGGFDGPDITLLLRDAAGLPPADPIQACPALGASIALRPN